VAGDRRRGLTGTVSRRTTGDDTRYLVHLPVIATIGWALASQTVLIGPLGAVTRLIAGGRLRRGAVRRERPAPPRPPPAQELEDVAT
jgi:hypothetical protein